MPFVVAWTCVKPMSRAMGQELEELRINGWLTTRELNDTSVDRPLVAERFEHRAHLVEARVPKSGVRQEGESCWTEYSLPAV